MSLKEKRKMQSEYSKDWETIEIDHRVYSRNKIDRMHWSAKGKLKKQYQNQPSRPAVCTVVVLPIAVIVVFGVVEHPSYQLVWWNRRRY